MANFARQNRSQRSKIDRSYVYASGAFKNVYIGKYTKGSRAGEECVCKIFKSGSVYEDSYFDSELKVVSKAIEIVNRFNKVRIIDKEVWVNEPEIWEFDGTRERNLVEPMIANFEKFNSNTGWTPSNPSPWIDVMQALSHYSYNTTNRRELICDLQGGVYKDGYVITDPVVMSVSREYGPTDLGSEGISNFFAYHECNKYCHANWMKPLDNKAYFKAEMGTTMALPTRHSRVPLSHHYH